MKLTYRGKYSKDTVLSVLYLLNKDLEIRKIAKITGVPETTIRNWKFGYTTIYGVNREFSMELQKQVLILSGLGFSMPQIAQKFGVQYNTIRLFLKGTLPPKEYGIVKVSNGDIADESRVLTPGLSYILGVMYGDGHFGPGQIRLGAKDKEFVKYFADTVFNWCKRKPSLTQFIQNDKPYYECYLSFKAAANLIHDLVEKRQEVPKAVFDSVDEEILINFIKGFSDSEGTIVTNPSRKSNFLKMYNQKKLVLKQIKEMMIKIGFDNDKLHIIVNNKAKGGDVFALRMCYNDQLRLFYQKIGFTIERKQRKLRECLKKE